MALRTPLLLAGCLLALSVDAMADAAHTYAFGQPATADKATRTVDVTLQDIAFSPKSLEVKADTVQITTESIRYLKDHVLDDMLRGLGLKVTNDVLPFEPEAGAYSSSHAHAHANGHAHEHD
jgi:hypothetical protein